MAFILINLVYVRNNVIQSEVALVLTIKAFSVLGYIEKLLRFLIIMFPNFLIFFSYYILTYFKLRIVRLILFT
jgi:hypothetical protein